MAEVVLSTLRAIQPVLGQHNRVARLCRTALNVHGPVPKSDPRWLTLIEATKDLHEYHYIVEVLGSRLSQTPFLDVLRRSMKDHLLSSQPSPDTDGRDAQFELFMAAVATRVGFVVERFGPGMADWDMRIPTNRLSMECKRLKSLDALQHNLKKAAEQIDSSPVGGIAVIDMSMAVNRGVLVVDGPRTETEVLDAGAQRTQFFVNEFEGRIRHWVEGSNIGVVVLHDHVLVSPGSGGNGAGTLWGCWQSLHLKAEGSTQRDRYEDMMQLLVTALPNY